MIRSDFGIALLKRLTTGAFSGISQGSAYLGLLTRMPDDANHCVKSDTNGWQEVPLKVNGYLNGEAVTNIDTGYARLQIGNSGTSGTGISGKSYFSQNAVAWDENEGDNGAVVAKNDSDDLMMHNIAEEGKLPRQDQAGATAYSWEIVGFGIFASLNGETSTDMLACGHLVDANGDQTTVTITEGSVPIFYKEALKLIFSDDPAPVAESNP